jgi:hypothetical protein
VADDLNAFGQQHQHTATVTEKRSKYFAKTGRQYWVQTRDAKSGELQVWDIGKANYDRLQPGEKYQFTVHDRLIQTDWVQNVVPTNGR